VLSEANIRPVEIYLFGAREVLGAPDTDAYRYRLSELRDDDWQLFAALALNHKRFVPCGELLQALWPERAFDRVLTGEDPDDHAAELPLVLRKERVEAGLKLLRNCVTRLRHFLRQAGVADEPIATRRADKSVLAGGAYRLDVGSNVSVDVASFVRLLSDGSTQGRLDALDLVRGPMLDDCSLTPGLRVVRSTLRSRVKGTIEELLPGAAPDKIASYVEDIVLHGNASRVRAHLLGLQRPARGAFVAPSLVDELPLGLESTAMSEMAQSTFKDLVTAWINSPTDTSGPVSVDIPVSHVVATTLPAQWGDMDSIRLNFLVFAADSHIPETDLETGELCFRYRLSELEAKTLREYVDTNPRAYFVLAVPKQPQARTARLILSAVEERFHFYAVDLVQYYRTHVQDDVLVPHQNRVNLALFSLIWAARWVEDFFGPLSLKAVRERKPLQETIDLVFSESPNLDAIRVRGWDALVKNVPDARGYVDPEVHRRVEFRVGMGAAMQLINDQMQASVEKGHLYAVRTYCPEALYGTANLWLFSRTYHQFMDTTARFQQRRKDFDNQRLLPAAQDLTDGSLLYAATLWHVVMLYRMRQARVSVVAMPAEAGQEDHGFYGGGIGDFMWIALDERTGGWRKDQAKASAQLENEEFINENERNVLAGSELSQKDYSTECGMSGDDLRLEAKPPTLLFPPDDAFVETPLQLWSSTASPWRLKGR
jgi:hypothetical protein